ncbi:MAG TPA: hypothetical protein VI383_02310 [Gemmatimonadales bacterium]|nr:hypothetical protein [Gemmatimonadales bacterium]
MPGPAIVELIAQINFAVETIEVGFRNGAIKASDITDLKGTIDDARLRLWALMNKPLEEDSVAFEERFRMRRARDICGRLAGDLAAGRISPRHPEFSELREISRTLSQAITVAGQPGS